MGWHWWILITLVLDLVFLSRFGREIGGGNLLLWLATAALLGLLAIRTGGFALRGPRPPGDLVDRGLIFLAGILLIFPGPLSDLLGLILLCPPLRNRIAGRIRDTAGRWLRGGNRFTFVKSPPGQGRPPGAPGTRRSGPEGGEGAYPGAAGARDVDFQVGDSGPGRSG